MITPSRPISSYPISSPSIFMPEEISGPTSSQSLFYPFVPIPFLRIISQSSCHIFGFVLLYVFLVMNVCVFVVTNLCFFVVMNVCVCVCVCQGGSDGFCSLPRPPKRLPKVRTCHSCISIYLCASIYFYLNLQNLFFHPSVCLIEVHISCALSTQSAWLTFRLSHFVSLISSSHNISSLPLLN